MAKASSGRVGCASVPNLDELDTVRCVHLLLCETCWVEVCAIDVLTRRCITIGVHIPAEVHGDCAVLRCNGVYHRELRARAMDEE